MSADEKGKCRSCKVDLVDWKRVHKRTLRDVAYTFDALKLEMVRHHNWHVDFDKKALRSAETKGRDSLIKFAETRINKYLAPATNAYDGRQTPFEGNVVYYAQHATATCCRTCLEYWHGIPKGRPLSEEEQNFCVRLIDLYLNRRLPELPEVPEESVLARLVKKR
ncbi:MAG TPA: DUF4186 family protein [Candidatus Obscuribacterales bacterium]|nr:DUF4186 family protein [Candidatus Obscuribacterales bacterium]